MEGEKVIKNKDKKYEELENFLRILFYFRK
jgi:hypothetical protein